MTAHDWLGRPVADLSGRRYARLDDLFVGRTSGDPEFGIVSLDAEGTERVAVPLREARPDAGAIVLPYDIDRVVAAPLVQGPVDEIPAESGRRVLEFFGVAAEAGDTPTVPLPDGAAADADEPTEVIVSEERLEVETRARPAERVRIRKAVVTEEVTVTVTLRREELVIDREPAGDDVAQSGEIGAPLAAGGELEILLHAEEPVVTRRVVPVERIRLRRNTIIEQEQITDTVRKERVVLDELPISDEETTP